jgi:DNA polymerase
VTAVSDLLDDLALAGIEATRDGDGLLLNPPEAARGRLDLVARARDLKPVLLAALGEPVFLDLETRSKADLKVVGGRNYALDPSTSILTAVALLDGKVLAWVPLATEAPAVTWPTGFGPALPVEVFVGPELPSPLAEAVAAGRAFCAHNARTFDSLVWAARGLPEPSRWLDTVPRCRAAGLPGALDAVGMQLFQVGKDPGGKRLIGRLCKPAKGGRFREPTPRDLAELLQYNLQDVLLLAKVYDAVPDHAEPDVLAVDRQINGRGIHFDPALAQRLLAIEDALLHELAAEAERLTGGEVVLADLNCLAYLLEWLQGRGIQVATLDKDVLDRLLRKRNLDPAVRAVLLARRAAGRKGLAKLKAAAARIGPDGRLRDAFAYAAAHTGRWKSFKPQLHNLPKPAPAVPADLEPLLAATDSLDSFRKALPAGVPVADGLSALIRPCFRAAPGKVLLIADYAQIEARTLAWLAGERALLDRFAAGEDVYLYGRPHFRPAHHEGRHGGTPRRQDGRPRPGIPDGGRALRRAMRGRGHRPGSRRRHRRGCRGCLPRRLSRHRRQQGQRRRRPDMATGWPLVGPQPGRP